MKHFFHLLIILMMSFVYADCSEIDNQEDCERMERCEWIESDNMPEGGYCVEGEGEDDEEDWEDCSEIDNQEDCERMERCEWSENAGCIEGDSDDEEDWEDCSEIDNQEDCERMEHCEWSENAGCIEGDSDDDGALENNYPLSYSLSQNYPNPFNPVTKIDFSIAESSHITLKVYDISGKEVSKLINEFYSAGNYTIKWDATDAYGKQLSAGIYIYQLNTKNGLFSNTMVLMK